MSSNIEPLSTVDAAWLRMEDPTNLMMVSGILTFKKPIELERLRAVLEHRLLQFDRFRMRVVEPKMPFAPAYWEYDPHFDLDAHLHHVALPAPGDQSALQDMCSDLMSTPLDFTKPLWMVHLIENYDGGTAVFVRLHHCIADGMALVYVLLSMTDMTPNAPLPSGDSHQPASHRGKLGGGMTSMLMQTSNVAQKTRGFSRRVLRGSREVLGQPRKVLHLASEGGSTAFAASRLVLRTNDPKTLFKGKLGVSKRAAWSRPISLKDVKAVKNVTGGTVNDVLVSAMAGGLRRYLLERGEPVNGLAFRAAVPINLRQPDEMGTLGNKFGLLFLTLPVGIADPLERLEAVRRRMGELKESKEGPVGLAILSGMGVTPQELHGALMELFGAKLTAVMTNVPGPPMPLFMAGQQIDQLMFWVPQSGRLGLGISIISYAGRVMMGVATDAGLVPDPEQIIEGFYKEFDALLDLARQVEQVAAEEANLSAVPEDQVDELQRVNGIGPVYAQRLRAANIQSLEQVAAMPVTTLADVLQTNAHRAETILAEIEQMYS
jgi:WS/DGAT/MGAT family acyltransferase